jgi:hypothetical protein
MLKRLAERTVAEPPDPRQRSRLVEFLCEDVRTESPANRAGALELEHGPVPEDCFVLGASQDEPGRPHPLCPARVDAPAAGHPQMTPCDDAAFEVEQEVLAHRLDALEHLAVDGGRDPRHLPPRMRRLGLEPLADEHLEPRSRARE